MTANAKGWLEGLGRSEPLVRAVEPRADAESLAEAEAEQDEDVHPSRAYGGLWSMRDRAHTAEFRFRDPQRADESVEYSFLSRVQWCKASGEIVLLYDSLGVTVTIRGFNLWELKERLRQHLVTYVQEQGKDALAARQAKEEARAAGREFVFVEEIVFALEEKEQEEGARG
jgi:hypothetical protein